MLLCKKKHARGNQMLFFDKELSKVVITRTKLHNNFLQYKSEENREIESFMQNKETFLSLFYKRSKRDITKF